jgi:hypothetical protein
LRPQGDLFHASAGVVMKWEEYSRGGRRGSGARPVSLAPGQADSNKRGMQAGTKTKSRSAN